MVQPHGDGTHYKRLVTDLAIQLDSWRQRAKCRDLSVKESDRLFFPIVRLSTDSPKEPGEYLKGKKFCFNCPVKAECLQWAMVWETDNSKRFGLYGGFSPGERAMLFRLIRELIPHPSDNIEDFEVQEC